MRVRVSSPKDPEWLVDEKIRMLGTHLAGPIGASLALARILGLSREEIASGLKSLQPIQRRLHLAYAAGDRLLIDDSYNITLDGVKAALEVLTRIQRRKIGVFAGIPEGGTESKGINEELGRIIAPAFTLILLGETPVSGAVLSGLVESGFPEANILRYSEAKNVEAILAHAAKDGDCIYFSAYDWPAIYL